MDSMDSMDSMDEDRLFLEARLHAVVIANPSDPRHALAVSAACERAGLPRPRISPGSARFPGDAPNDPVERAHLKAARAFARRSRGGALRGRHLLVLEDDCEFVGDAAGALARALRWLDRRPASWASLHAGHLPAGPTVPVKSLGGPYVLTWTSLPFTGHAYVLNRLYAERVVAGRRFRRPYSQEGLCQLPLFKKFALQPVVATQNRRPKELCDIDSTRGIGGITSSYDFADFNHLFCALGLLQTVVLAAVLARVVRTALQVVGGSPGPLP